MGELLNLIKFPSLSAWRVLKVDPNKSHGEKRKEREKGRGALERSRID